EDDPVVDRSVRLAQEEPDGKSCAHDAGIEAAGGKAEPRPVEAAGHQHEQTERHGDQREHDGEPQPSFGALSAEEAEDRDQEEAVGKPEADPGHPEFTGGAGIDLQRIRGTEEAAPDGGGAGGGIDDGVEGAGLTALSLEQETRGVPLHVTSTGT